MLPRMSSGILPGISNPIRGAAGVLQDTLSSLNKYVGGAVSAAPYTPVFLIGGGISIVKGRLSGLNEQRRHRTSPMEESPQTTEVTNIQGMVRGSIISVHELDSVSHLISYIDSCRLVGELARSTTLRIRGLQCSTIR